MSGGCINPESGETNSDILNDVVAEVGVNSDIDTIHIVPDILNLNSHDLLLQDVVGENSSQYSHQCSQGDSVCSADAKLNCNSNVDNSDVWDFGGENMK